MRAATTSIIPRFIAPFLALCICLAPRATFAGAAADPVAGEYDIKAAFIYQFIHFTEWSNDAFEDDESPIVVALVGDDPFRGALARAVRDKRVHGRRLVYRHFPNVNALEPCHVLYVSPSERAQLTQVLSQARDFGALTVGDMGDFTAEGGMVRFYNAENKVRFEIRRTAVQEAGLKIQSKLLRLARIYSE